MTGISAAVCRRRDAGDQRVTSEKHVPARHLNAEHQCDLAPFLWLEAVRDLRLALRKRRRYRIRHISKSDRDRRVPRPAWGYPLAGYRKIE